MRGLLRQNSGALIGGQDGPEGSRDRVEVALRGTAFEGDAGLHGLAGQPADREGAALVDAEEGEVLAAAVGVLDLDHAARRPGVDDEVPFSGSVEDYLGRPDATGPELAFDRLEEVLVLDGPPRVRGGRRVPRGGVGGTSPSR